MAYHAVISAEGERTAFFGVFLWLGIYVLIKNVSLLPYVLMKTELKFLNTTQTDFCTSSTYSAKLNE